MAMAARPEPPESEDDHSDIDEWEVPKKKTRNLSTFMFAAKSCNYSKPDIYFDAPSDSSSLTSESDSEQRHEGEEEKITRIIENFRTYNSRVARRGVKLMRKALTQSSDPPRQRFVAGGVIPKLVECLYMENNPAIKYEAAWCFGCLAEGQTPDCIVICESGALTPLISMLGNDDDAIVGSALWALSNLAGDCLETRDLVVQAGIMDALDELLARRMKVETCRIMCWIFMNIIRRSPLPLTESHYKICVKFIQIMIHYQDDQIRDSTVWFACYMARISSQRALDVLRSGIISRLIQLTRCEKTAVVKYVLGTFGAITQDKMKKDQVIELLSFGILRHVVRLLNHRSQRIQGETCWVLANIMAVVKEAVPAIMDLSAVPGIMKVLQHTEERNLVARCHALYCLENLTFTCSKAQIDRELSDPEFRLIMPLIRSSHHEESMLALCTMMNVARATRYGRRIYMVMDELRLGDVIAGMQNHAQRRVRRAARLLTLQYEHAFDGLANGDELAVN